jgi:hypothetical protein
MEYYASITEKQGNDKMANGINGKIKPQDFTRITHDNAQRKESVYCYFGRESLEVNSVREIFPFIWVEIFFLTRLSWGLSLTG